MLIALCKLDWSWPQTQCYATANGLCACFGVKVESGAETTCAQMSACLFQHNKFVHVY